MRDVKGANGFILARVDASGNVTMGPDPGPIAGRVNNKGDVFDDEGGAHQVGHVDGEGTVSDMAYETVARVDAWGRVHSVEGELFGTVENPIDAGVLVFLTGAFIGQKPKGATKPEDSALMDEALGLAEEQRYPGVRKDAKPLTERDLFTERLRRD